MTADDPMIGDDPLVDGMRLSLRLRQDFVVTDAHRLLLAARRIHRELHPDADAEEAVTCAADALFVILEHAGLVGDVADSRLAAHAGDGLEAGGHLAQIVFNDAWPLSRRGDCLRTDDVFALPPAEGIE